MFNKKTVREVLDSPLFPETKRNPMRFSLCLFVGNPPTLGENVPTLVGKAPTFVGRALTPVGKPPTSCGNAPTLCGNVPTLVEKLPTVVGKAPTYNLYAITDKKSLLRIEGKIIDYKA